MSGGLLALQKAGRAENERAGANRGHIGCCGARAPYEIHGFRIGECIDDAKPARHQDHVEMWRVRECAGRHKAETAIAGYGIKIFRENVGLCARHPAEDLQRAGKVQLRHVREKDKSDIHAAFPFRRPRVMDVLMQVTGHPSG